MAYWIKHKFVSAKGDGTNTTLVKPSNWNDDHEFWMDEGTIIARPPGSGPGPGVEYPISMLFPSGMVSPFAGGTPPVGWLLCNGVSLLRTEYPTLFTAIGITYGSADAAHFNVPDIRGRVIAGVDPGTGRIGQAIYPLLGGTGGQEMVQYYADIGGSCSVSVSVGVSVSGSVSGSIDGYASAGGGSGAGSNFHAGHYDVSYGGSMSGGGSGSGGGSISGGGYTRNGTNAQPTIVLNYMIKT